MKQTFNRKVLSAWLYMRNKHQINIDIYISVALNHRNHQRFVEKKVCHYTRPYLHFLCCFLFSSCFVIFLLLFGYILFLFLVSLTYWKHQDFSMHERQIRKSLQYYSSFLTQMLIWCVSSLHGRRLGVG